MDINEKISKRRKELGLDMKEICKHVNIGLPAYNDIETYEDEAYNTADTSDMKRICRALDIDYFELFEIKCAFCKGRTVFRDEYTMPRNELVRNKRESLRLSFDELGDIVGFYGQAIIDMEKDPYYLDGWPYDLVRELAKAIDVPLQILLGVKCRVCGK